MHATQKTFPPNHRDEMGRSKDMLAIVKQHCLLHNGNCGLSLTQCLALNGKSF